VSYAHMPICPYVIVIELDKRHVIVFLTYAGFTYMSYAMCLFAQRITCFPFHMVYLISCIYDNDIWAYGHMGI
jgi:hypothetical protein